jgi:peptidoglycan hydrolase CwlO-like protein
VTENTDAATFAAVLALIALITDAPACRARTLQLQKQADQARDQQAKLAGEVEAHNRRVAEFEAKVEAAAEEKARLEADLKAARAEVGQLSNRINDEANARMRNRNPSKPMRLVPAGPGGMMQSIQDDRDAADPHFGRVA